MAFVRCAALLVLPLLAGCVEDSGSGSGDGLGDGSVGGDPDWGLHGSFTETRKSSDLDDLDRRVKARGGEVAILESFPEQFHAYSLTSDQCEALRAELEDVPYVADVGSCAPD